MRFNFATFPAVMLLAGALLLLSCEGSKAPVADEFRGNPITSLPADGILRASGSPYLATDTLIVRAGQTLTIEPGVELRFEPGLPFIIEGKITAVGSELAPISFTSGLKFPRRGDWDGIWMRNADNSSRFEYCRFLFGAKYGRHYAYREVRPGTIDSTVVEYGSLTLKSTSPTIKRSWFLSGGFHGLFCDSSSNPVVEHNLFFDNAGHGIWVHSSSDPLMQYNIISENDDYGVYCSEQGEGRRSDLRLSYNIVRENFSGEFNQQAPLGLGRISTINANLDSCDYRYNLRLNPNYVGASKMKHGARWEFKLTPGSAAIDAGPEGIDLESDGTRADFGIYRYEYRPGEIRRRIPNLPIVGDRLDAAHSPYYMSYDVVVPEGVTLTLDPGVEIRVEGRYTIRLKGRIVSNGTAGNPVRIVSALNSPKKGDWVGLVFEEGGDAGSELHYTQIQHSRFGLKFVGRDALVNSCTIAEVDSVGVLAERESAPIITDCSISDASIAAVLCQFNSSPLIRRNIISRGGGYGILARESSLPTIVNNVIHQVGVAGIRLENLSHATIRNNVFADNGYFGIYCFNNSSPDVRNNIFWSNGTQQRGGVGVYALRTSRPDMAYNDFWDNPVSAVSISGDTTIVNGTNIRRDPQFVNPLGGDFHLKPGSPGLNSGDPTLLNPDGSTSHRGAYGGPDAR